MKIAGIYPLTNRKQPQKTVSLDEPIGLECVLAIAKARGHEIKVFRPSNFEDIGKDIAYFKPDIVLYSLMTCQYNSGKEINQKLKENFKIISIAGGYHPSAFPLVAVKDGFDFVVVGEGETTFDELLTHIENNNNDFTDIKGLAFKDDEKFINTGPGKRIENLDIFPDPYRDPEILNNQEGMIYLNYPPTSQRRIAYMEYSRGCLFNCAFCCSPVIMGRFMSFRSPERIINQIRYLKKNFNINYLFFVDLNITLNREKLLEFCEALINSKENIYWTCMSGFSTVDNNVLEKMKEAGCTKIGWGIETLSKDMINETDKLPSKDKIIKTLNYSAQLGILNEGFLMLGFPWDDKDKIKNFSYELQDLNLHMIRPAIFTPLPSCRDYDLFNKEGKIFEKNWDKFDCTHLVWQHPNLTEEEIINLQKFIFKDFYNSKRYKERIDLFLEKHPHFQRSFEEFLPLLKF